MKCGNCGWDSTDEGAGLPVYRGEKRMCPECGAGMGTAETCDGLAKRFQR